LIKFFHKFYLNLTGNQTRWSSDKWTGWTISFMH